METFSPSGSKGGHCQGLTDGQIGGLKEGFGPAPLLLCIFTSQETVTALNTLCTSGLCHLLMSALLCLLDKADICW